MRRRKRTANAEVVAEAEAPLLGERAVRFPISVRTPRLTRLLHGVASALAGGDLDRAESLAADLVRMPSFEVGGRPEKGPRSAPTLRAKAIAAVLLDLARNHWRVTLEDGQVYVVAPTWRAGAEGLSPDEVREEKRRIRESMAARVREQLTRGPTRNFIEACESAHHTAEGPRSILNLVAEGGSLAEALKREGAEAIKPYLQAADGAAGVDSHTGLPLTDIFRYFRYYWSFPFGSTPGRSLPFLIRDAGQPCHPVCGLLAIASPVPRLTVRDTALGWTPAWLDAQVVALGATQASLREVLSQLEAGLLHSAEDLRPAGVWADLAAALGVGGSSAAEIAASFARIGGRVAEQRLRAARKRLCLALADEVEAAIRAISLEGLRTTHAQALRDPSRASAALARQATKARERFKESRRGSDPGAFTRASEALKSGLDYSDLSKTPLFRKKRAAQAAQLLSVWAEVKELRGERGWDTLQELAVGASGRYTRGASVSPGLRVALQQLRSRLLASQVVDVTVCGAVPPYGPLLGGKLAALLALSRGPAKTYAERYRNSESEISSQMAGRPVVRPADLVTLTTTSFYGVGSSQYERVSLTPSVRWRFVGYSRGHGTLHFSETTSATLLQLFEAETGHSLHTSTFGEGPSERLRKVRDGLAILELNASDLLQHGMPRQVFIAELIPHATRPGFATEGGKPWHSRGPTEVQAVEHWRARWLAPRLVRLPAIIQEVSAFRRTGALLSTRLPPRDAATTVDGRSH